MNRILVVDDEAAMVDVIREFLESRGYEVRSVTDSRKAAELFRVFSPDLCVLDFNMPELTGAEVFEQFKSIDPTVEVIFLTAQAETCLAIDLMKAGAIDYLLKPAPMKHLLAAVERALEHRRLQMANREYQRLLEDIVAQRTAALNTALAGLADMHSATLEALGMALDFRDQSTSGHSRRVARWTIEIAQMIGVCGEALAQIEQGALLHDIGKLRIPDNILLKPGPLDTEEWRIMRRHAEYGREFLCGIEFLRPAADLVYSHHEKFDGTGYPRGLRGDAIPIGARCFAIVDAVDAMLFKRPYNQPVSFDRAAAEIRRCAGTHFDPQLAEIALEFLKEIFAREAPPQRPQTPKMPKSA